VTCLGSVWGSLYSLGASATEEARSPADNDQDRQALEKFCEGKADIATEV
jgi:hypothetical protein